MHLVGRSFKYHRPRGILSAGAEEPNALVTVIRDAARSTPNLRATQVELYEGLIAESQNRWPSLEARLRAHQRCAVGILSRGLLLQDLHVAEEGLEGALRAGDSPRRGLRARARRSRILIATRTAMHTARCSSSVPVPRVLRRLSRRPNSAPASSCAKNRANSAAACSPTRRRSTVSRRPHWVQQSVATLAQNPRVTLLARTTAFGYFPHNLIGLNQRLTDHLANPPPDAARERLWQVRARSVVLATGAIERPLIFPGNDRPGIMLRRRCADLSQPLRRARRFARGHRHLRRSLLSNGAGFARGRRRHRRHRGSARRSERPAARGGAPRRNPGAAGLDRDRRLMAIYASPASRWERCRTAM